MACWMPRCYSTALPEEEEDEEKKKKHGTIDDFMDKYFLEPQVLGRGTFAEVRLATLIGDKDQEYAVKIVSKLDMSMSERNSLYCEVDILKKLHHPNIVKVHDTYENEEHMLIVMDFISGGELFKKLEVADNYTEQESKRIIKTLAQSLKYLSDRGVVHRDLKPENILLTSDDNDADIVLCDFGFAYDLPIEAKGFDLLQTMCGTASYVAPEVISGSPYSYKCDIWSLGVISFILLSGGYTLYSGNQKNILKQVRKGAWDFRPESAWENVSDNAKDFLKHILVRNPKRRYNYEMILNHKWFTEEDDNDNEPEINVKELIAFNMRRRLYAVAKAKRAAEVFINKGFSSSRLFNENSMKGNMGLDVFADMMDE